MLKMPFVVTGDTASAERDWIGTFSSDRAPYHQQFSAGFVCRYDTLLIKRFVCSPSYCNGGRSKKDSRTANEVVPTLLRDRAQMVEGSLGKGSFKQQATFTLTNEDEFPTPHPRFPKLKNKTSCPAGVLVDVKKCVMWSYDLLLLPVSKRRSLCGLVAKEDFALYILPTPLEEFSAPTST
ncbi:unnamed protein product [Phytophthora fragariaefolia]|uniref:Unnamed protein product n=1 Tax=Phytophthora fragariaefolia TaxID=1490495 RepID=A0A9W6TYS7_9STRA|nr:unnamed protein product [Phytophthora fragariaefolia]